jgi:hypothetical protein
MVDEDYLYEESRDIRRERESCVKESSEAEFWQ